VPQEIRERSPWYGCPRPSILSPRGRAKLCPLDRWPWPVGAVRSALARTGRRRRHLVVDLRERAPGTKGDPFVHLHPGEKLVPNFSADEPVPLTERSPPRASDRSIAGAAVVQPGRV